MSLPNCSFGENDESNCHSTIYTHGKSAILLITDLSTEDIDLLVWRTGVRKRNLKTICLHHQKIYLEKYSKLNPYCCDPFNKHSVNIQNCKGEFHINGVRCEYKYNCLLYKIRYNHYYSM